MRERKNQNQETGAPETGIVLWYYREKKFGFVRPDEGDRILFVHERFVSEPGRIPLRAGMRVQFIPRHGPKGLEAHEVRRAGSATVPGVTRPRKSNGAMAGLHPMLQRILKRWSLRRKKRLQRIVTYYPRFRSLDDLTSHFHKATWYLPRTPGILESVSMVHTLASGVKPASRPPHMFQSDLDSSHIRLETGFFRFVLNLVRSRLILVWKGYNPKFWGWMKFLGVQSINVDADDLASMEYGRYCDIFWAHLLDNKQKFHILSDNYRRFSRVAKETKEKQYPCCCVFGTGPSLETAFEFDFDGSLSIVCNSIIQNDALMDHIHPKFICAGDAVSHFGVSRYAEKFREDLCRTLQTRDMYFFTTAAFGYLLTLQHPEIEERTILAEQVVPGPHFDLMHGFGLPLLASTLNIHMLPLATTFSETILLLGCDGKSLEGDNEDFWAHAKSSQYHDLVDSGHRCHPTFDTHRQRTTYQKCLQSIESYISTGERMHGKTFRTLKPSNIPALKPRWISIAGKPGPEVEKIAVTGLVKASPTTKVAAGNCDLPVRSGISEAVCTADGSLYVRGWILSPSPVEGIEIFASNRHLGSSMLKYGSPVALKEEFPEYDEQWPCFEFYGEAEPGDANVQLTIQFYANQSLVKKLDWIARRSKGKNGR